MINILSNPLLRAKQLKSIPTKEIRIRSNISLTTAILSLFSLTVISYVVFWLFCNKLISDNGLSSLSDIKNFAFVSGVFSFVIAFFCLL